jgi:hypothetical protein
MNPHPFLKNVLLQMPSGVEPGDDRTWPGPRTRDQRPKTRDQGPPDPTGPSSDAVAWSLDILPTPTASLIAYGKAIGPTPDRDFQQAEGLPHKPNRRRMLRQWSPARRAKRSAPRNRGAGPHPKREFWTTGHGTTYRFLVIGIRNTQHASSSHHASRITPPSIHQRLDPKPYRQR